MLHLSLLAGSLISATIACKILLYSMNNWRNWRVRRFLQLLGLCIPFSLLLFFSLMNLPAIIENPAKTLLNHTNQAEWLAGLVSLLLLLVIFAGAVLLNLARVALLWWYLWYRSWPTPPTLQLELNRLQPHRPQVRLRIIHNPAPLAFTVSGWPGLRSFNWIIISSGLVQVATEAELLTVFHHELAHVKRGDFWVTWLAGLLRDAFFYLPTTQHLFKLWEADKEFACDEIAVGAGSHQLDLASMLIKIWETTLDNTTPLPGKSKPPTIFRTPGLTGLNNRPKAKDEASLLETRIRLLMGLDEGSLAYSNQNTTPQWWSYGLLSGSASLWLVTVGVVNLIMLPLGCALGLNI